MTNHGQRIYQTDTGTDFIHGGLKIFCRFGFCGYGGNIDYTAKPEPACPGRNVTPDFERDYRLVRHWSHKLTTFWFAQQILFCFHFLLF